MKTTATYRGYTIRIKRDFGRFGWWDSTQGRNRKRGVVVTDGFCNVMPGAAWFQSVDEACQGIDALNNVGLGFDVMQPLSLDAKIERETRLGQKWWIEVRRLARAATLLSPSTLKAVLAD